MPTQARKPPPDSGADDVGVPHADPPEEPPLSQAAVVTGPRIGATTDPSELVAGVAHEMKTPLTALIQALDIVSSGRSGPLGETQQRFVRMAISNAQALLEMTLRLQDTSKWDSGRATPRFATFDAEGVARSTCEAMSALAESRGIALDVSVPGQTPAGWGDAALVRELLFNLVGNALKFTPERGHVVVIVQASDERPGMLELLVRDDGPGIPPGDEERIFEKFYQAETTSLRKREGLGLGLALARGIATAHGGTAHARNNAGRGCTFRVRLPAAVAGMEVGDDTSVASINATVPARAASTGDRHEAES